MTHWIQTRRGALYFVDDLERIWVRIRGADSEVLRTDTGVFYKCLIADRVILHCPPFDPTKPEIERVIKSSTIVSIEELS